MSNLLSENIARALGNSSMIRKMFEAGNELRKKYGNDKVYDFSLGNPDVPAPELPAGRQNAAGVQFIGTGEYLPLDDAATTF